VAGGKQMSPVNALNPVLYFTKIRKKNLMLCHVYVHFPASHMPVMSQVSRPQLRFCVHAVEALVSLPR
jgi:hypothetical protein